MLLSRGLVSLSVVCCLSIVGASSAEAAIPKNQAAEPAGHPAAARKTAKTKSAKSQKAAAVEKKKPKSDIAKNEKSRPKSKSKSESRVSPAAYVQNRVEKLYAQLMARAPRMPLSGAASLADAPARKAPWLSAVYARNLVEASPQTELLADKLIMSRVLQMALDGDVHRFYPKTIGLKDFLHRHHLVDASGRVTAEGEKIEKALYEEFPAGFVVRPAVGVAPKETRKGLFPEGDEFVVALLSGKSPMYEPSHYRQPVKSSILDAIASGEAVILQDDIILRADAKRKLQTRTFREVRIHTYEDQVVADAIPVRWVQQAEVGESEIRSAELFVSGMLGRLPPRLLTRQAWGVDVAVFDNGELMITDIVTNRGRRIQWSGYLEQPRVLGAYTRHFENVAGLRFDGVAGSLMRNNFGNYMPYWDTRIQKAKPGWGKVLSYLPPVP